MEVNMNAFDWLTKNAKRGVAISYTDVWQVLGLFLVKSGAAHAFEVLDKKDELVKLAVEVGFLEEHDAEKGWYRIKDQWYGS
jgi:hypothetical protein